MMPPPPICLCQSVAFVIPDMEHDMHNGAVKDSVSAADAWLRRNLDGYYQWAKAHNSGMICKIALRRSLRGRM